MRKVNKYMFMVMTAVVFSACGDDNEYEGVGPQDNVEAKAGVTFVSAGDAAEEADPDSETVFTVELMRDNTKGVVDVEPEFIKNTDDLFEVSAAHFADGEDRATVTVKSIKAPEAGRTYDVELTVPEAYRYLYKETDGFFSYKRTFTYVTWNVVATGTYTYSLYFEGEDAGLSLYRCVQFPERYKIANWGGGVDFFFTHDAKDNVEVASCFIGYVHPSYGDVYVSEVASLKSVASEAQYSYYDGESNTYFFDVAYHVSAGVFGLGYETFKLDEINNNE